MAAAQAKIRTLIAYSFSGEEADVDAPNFYRRSAETSFAKLDLEPEFLPNLRNASLYRLLRRLGAAHELALPLTLFAWLARHRRRYDIALGWVTNGVVAGWVKFLFPLSAPRVGMILYKVPMARGALGQVKAFIVRVAARAADRVMALDQRQTAELGVSLGCSSEKMVTLRYGVDTEWYGAAQAKHSSSLDGRSIFVPGGAYRDDECLLESVRELDVVVKRYQLDVSRVPRRDVHRHGCAEIEEYRNAPYATYIEDCLHSAIVVIPVCSKDKPVGLTALLECMALGRPVIIAAGASSRDYVIDGKTALVYEPGNALDLRHKIAYLLQDRAYAEELAVAARQAAERDHGLAIRGAELARQLRSMVTK